MLSNSSNGYIQWYEFAPQSNVIVIKYTPDETKKVTATGIIIPDAAMSPITDRPSTGVIVSKGPDAKEVEVGMQVFFPPQNAFDMNMIITEGEEKYLMTTSNRIDGIRVKDVRDNN